MDCRVFALELETAVGNRHVRRKVIATLHAFYLTSAVGDMYLLSGAVNLRNSGSEQVTRSPVPGGRSKNK